MAVGVDVLWRHQASLAGGEGLRGRFREVLARDRYQKQMVAGAVNTLAGRQPDGTFLAMLFLYRPRQTWMPFRMPREPTEQAAYNRQLQESYAATRRVAPVPAGPEPAPAPPGRDTIADLKDLAELHATGMLSDAEFAAAKAKLLGTDVC
jgi:Short C-terminal domain